MATKKKDIKVKDLKPNKDAKGGAQRRLAVLQRGHRPAEAERREHERQAQPEAVGEGQYGATSGTGLGEGEALNGREGGA